ncbi:hypothetical protein AVEN_1321-1 [Araneus ventricosus]|uniref:Endonuclease/exonuclease/phosphatase domain-containing protein n=1 Tax=Araneus ventricosus TaxID=182803 RepID=A0A4Y2D5Y6_ARAVE|nr:hypothetical protein AVEN_1321-1 [Araneus ventricosus]
MARRIPKCATASPNFRTTPAGGRLTHETASATLAHNLLRKNIDNIAVTEPFTVNGHVTGFCHDFNVVYQVDIPRTAILVRKSLNFMPLKIERDLIVLNIDFKGLNVLFMRLYCPANDNLTDYIIKIESAVQRFWYQKIIVNGVFNAKSTAWGPRVTDYRGEEILEFIYRQDLPLINFPDSPPIFDSSREISWIDLTFTMNFDRKEIADRTVNSDEMCSDLKLITYNWHIERFKKKIGEKKGSRAIKNIEFQEKS